MGQVLHGSATTTEAVRRAIQLRQESVRALAKRYGVSPTTVQKWRKRSTTADAPMGPKEPRSTVLSQEEEAIIVAFRRHTLLPLDDCLYGLQPTIPHLTRSSLHRCLERHGISRLPDMEGEKPKTKRFAAYAIGYFHMDIAEVRTEEGKLYLFVAIDRTSKLAFAKSAGPTPMSGMAPHRSSQRSMSPPASLSANATNGTGPPSFSTFSKRSTRGFRPSSTSTSSWTTTRPTKPRPSGTG